MCDLILPAGQGIVTYFDSYYRIGVASAPLIRGVDCPQCVALCCCPLPKALN